MDEKDLIIIKDQEKIKEVRDIMKNAWIKKSKDNLFKNIRLGVKDGDRTYDVCYIDELDAWACFDFSPKDKPTRYWNAFGFGNPLESNSIICEINFNFGIELRVAGRIAINPNGETYILHTGRLGGNYNSQDFWDNYDGNFVNINEKKHAVVSKANSNEIVGNIINFVKRVESIKKNLKKKPTLLSPLTPALKLIKSLDEKYSEKPEFEEVVVNQIKRPSDLRDAIIETRGAKCQICGYEGFRKKDGSIYAETHHMIELNKLAPKTLQSWNVLVLCPLCHRKMHYADVKSELLDKGWKIIIDGEEHIII